MRRLLKVLVFGLFILVVLFVAGAVWARIELGASLPVLDGRHQLAGVSAPVEVARDRLGIPSIRASTREDVARTLGFLHAQDRFFQMDLARRRAAGELAALVGTRALAIDRATRVHRFRDEARRAVALMMPDSRRLLDAYTAGVNSGLSSLAARPFEYALLRQPPEPWRNEDSLLVVLSMFVTLQDPDGDYESTLGTMHDILPKPMFEFLAPHGTEWDTPMVGGAFSMPPVPGPEIYDLRARRVGKPVPPPSAPSLQSAAPASTLDRALNTALDLERADPEAIGSNNWAVSGALTADGRPLLANDMHLFIRVPNTWYRASMEWPDPSNRAEPHRLIGLTLPGVPALVTGSNTHIAWGFTNTYADWGDLVLLETDPANPHRYQAEGGWRDTQRFDETIAVAGEPAQHETVEWTIWGPVLGVDYRGRSRAYSWVAHSAERLATTISPLESARTIEDAFAQANGLGTPGQNFVVADSDGNIGWSIYGAIPRRAGLDGSLPSSWADGSRGWRGWLDRSEYPRIVNPPDGRLWTANARVVDGEMLRQLGDGSYEVGARARIIHERLTARDRFTPRDMLAIQLDTRAEFLDRWRTLLLDSLTTAVVANHPDRAEVRRLLDSTWTGEASPQSPAYAFTHIFRDTLSDRIAGFVLSECYNADPTFRYSTVRRREGPIWKLIAERPLHLLDPRYATWDELIVSAVDEAISQMKLNRAGELRDRTWSEFNVTAYRHPLSGAAPLLWRWLDMPLQPLPGDQFTVQVHSGAIAASARMVVSPGREAEGIMQMPTGQSGHPLSPFYANSHQAWVNGDATPFLPGPAEHSLTLEP